MTLKDKLASLSFRLKFTPPKAGGGLIAYTSSPASAVQHTTLLVVIREGGKCYPSLRTSAGGASHRRYQAQPLLIPALGPPIN